MPAAAAALAVLVAGGCADGPGDDGRAAAGETAGPGAGSPPPSPEGTTTPSTRPAPTTTPPPPETVRITAVGDVIMGAVPPVPPDGRTLFGEVGDLLAGDVVLANLDQTITDATASSKCAPDADSCYAFRTPPPTARWLADAGFTVVNLANNHTRDFGPAGLADTRAALDDAGVASTGMPDQITYLDAGDVRVAVLGFAPYSWTESLLDIPGAVRLVEEAVAEADLVVVTIHAGAEGAEFQHVRPGTETFLGEDRGDAVAFSHAVVAAGADVVLGAGPHVLRGMEFHEGRLIAYSLGNFTGYRTLSNDGPNGVGAVLTVEVAADGTWRGGELAPTVMVDPGVPRPDPDGRALDQVRRLSADDFGACAVDLAADGSLGKATC